MVSQLHKVAQRRGFVAQTSSNRRKVFCKAPVRLAIFDANLCSILDVLLCESRMTSRGRSSEWGTRPQFVKVSIIYSTQSDMQSKKGGQ